MNEDLNIHRKTIPCYTEDGRLLDTVIAGVLETLENIQNKEYIDFEIKLQGGHIIKFRVNGTKL